MSFDINIDLYGSGTPQMKRYDRRFDPRTGRNRIFTFADPKVAKTQRVIAMLAKAALGKYQLYSQLPPHGTPIMVQLAIFYAAPQSRRRGKGAVAWGDPCDSHSCGDCDNKAKLILDALTQAGCWKDDKDVTSLAVTKRWTLDTPKIHIEIDADRNIADIDPDHGMSSPEVDARGSN